MSNSRGATEVSYGKTDGVGRAGPDEIRAHVARIVASELFAGAERLCRFVRFTVECRLDGRAEQVKEYVLGREVFDRGDDYDPRVDPIVRVEARRLRWRLAEYYAGPGRAEPLRLDYPKGSYVPTVHLTDVREVRARVSRRWPAVAAVTLVLALAIGAFVANRTASRATVAPVPLTWIQTNDGSLKTSDVMLAEDVDVELANRPGSQVVAWPEIVRKKSLRFAALRDFASELAANRLLLIMVRDAGPRALVRVFVVDEPCGQKRLALTYTQPAVSTFAEQNSLARRIAHDVIPQL